MFSSSFIGGLIFGTGFAISQNLNQNAFVENQQELAQMRPFSEVISAQHQAQAIFRAIRLRTSCDQFELHRVRKNYVLNEELETSLDTALGPFSHLRKGKSSKTCSTINTTRGIK